MSHKPIWYLKEMPPEFCDKAVEEFLKIAPREANMGQSGERFDHVHRNTKVRFVEPGHWLSYIMHGVAREANLSCKWHYDISGQENIQFAEYGVNQHYNWHVDVFPLGEQGLDRKISVVCLLSDPSEFTGGEFEARLYETYKAPLKKGTIIAFPSIIEHRVAPVTSGLRRSATVWMNGPRFK